MKLHLENFGQHTDLTVKHLTQNECLLVLGKNRVGKTTVRDAIEFALLGACRLRQFDTLKAIRENLITDGARHMAVEFVSGGFGVRRTINRKSSHKIEVLRGTIWMEANATEYGEYMRLDPDAVRVSLDSSWFFAMSADARRALLMEVSPAAKITADEVWEELPKAVRDFAKKDPTLQGTLKGLCAVAANSFQQANGKAGEARRQAKRDRDETKSHINRLCADAPTNSHDGFDIRDGAYADHEAGLVALAEDAQSMHEEYARANAITEGVIQEATQARDHAKRELDELCDIENQETIREQLAAIDEQRSEVDAIALEVAREIHEHEIRSNELIKRLNDKAPVVEQPGNCPAVDFEMPCPVSAETWTKKTTRKKMTAKQRAELSAENQGVVNHTATLRVKLEEHATTDAGLGEQAKALEERIAMVSRQEMAQQGVVESARQTQARLDEIERLRDEAPEGPALEAVEESKRLADWGRAFLEKRIEHDQHDGEISSQRKTESHRESLVEWWDTIEKQFRPEGIESRMSTLATSQFTQVLKQSASLARVEVDEEMDVTFNGRHIAACSESEQLCGGMAISAACSTSIGLGFVVVDRVDKLDREWKQAFSKWAGEIRKQFRSGMIAIATTDADPPDVPGEGFSTLWLRVDEEPLTLGGGFE